MHQAVLLDSHTPSVHVHQQSVHSSCTRQCVLAQYLQGLQAVEVAEGERQCGLVQVSRLPAKPRAKGQVCTQACMLETLAPTVTARPQALDQGGKQRRNCRRHAMRLRHKQLLLADPK